MKPEIVAKQMVRVLADDWPSTVGVLQRFERTDESAAWTAVGDAVPVSLGKNGLAWGLGRYPENPLPDAKQEGDGCAPAGIFALTKVFADPRVCPDLALTARLPCRDTCTDLKCVDDPLSRHYNTLVDQSAVAADWASAEDMLRPDSRYAAGIVVDHNPHQLTGAGSCIFIHVHAGPGVATAGCTAADLADVLTLCRWLDAAAQPLLVQLPIAVYREKTTEWGLPPHDSEGMHR